MPETPNENKRLKLSEKFNVQLKQHLSRLGWTDPEQQNRFVALINSYVLSGKSTSAQRVINNYLDKGLDILNLELKRIEITKDNNIVQVNPDEVEDTPQIQQEVISEKEFNSILENGRKRRLSTANILKEEIERSGSDSKKIMSKILKKRGDKNLAEEFINHLLSKRVLLEQGSVNANNFRVFLNNYLTSDKGWASGSIESLISGILKLVEKGAGDINAQQDIIRELDLLLRNMSKVVELKSAEQTKNSKTAFNELSMFASKLRGWSSEFFSEFMSQIMQIIGTAKSPKLQNYVSNQLGDLHNKIKSSKQEPKEEPEQKTDQQADQKEPAPKEEANGRDPRTALTDDYGNEITKAERQILDMQRAVQDLPEGFVDTIATELEQIYNPDLVEHVFSMILDDQGVDSGHFQEMVMEFGNPDDVFDVIGDIHSKFKDQELI